jgi:hypothetical protein
MKAILEFNLPEDTEELNWAIKATKMRDFIFHLNHNFDRQFDRPGKVTAQDVLEALREAARDYEVQDI